MEQIVLVSRSKTSSHLVGQSNTTKIVCISCNKLKCLSFFEIEKNGSRRNECRSCRLSGGRKRISKTPYAYINNLYSQLAYRRAKTHKFTISREDLHKIYDKQKGVCAYSGLPMTYIKDGAGYHLTNISIDRINNNRGYTKKNVCLVCLAVNMMKYTMDLDELIDWCKLISSNN